MPIGRPDRPVIGICEKCGTEGSTLHEYNGRKLCKANGCIEEEIERDSGKVERDQEFLEGYRSVVRGVQGD